MLLPYLPYYYRELSYHFHNTAQVLGKTHELTLAAVHSLGVLCQDSQKYVEAEVQ